jgi:L,D-transpeptidase YcbB
VFPNEGDVYLHATPTPALFHRNRRDFSHGCLRVEDVIGLAEWALMGQPAWTRQRIVDAMNGTASLHVKLPQPIRVVLFYMTAAIMPEDGAIHFAGDIYGHDEKLDSALARRDTPR